MTYDTLEVAGVEKALGDLGITRAVYSRQNAWADRLALAIVNTATDAPDLFPHDAQIQLRIGRIPADRGGSCTANGGPRTGVTQWQNDPASPWAKRIFVGYAVEKFRSGTSQYEGFDYKFIGPWERFMEATVFQKLYSTWDGAQQILRYTAEVVLGLSLNTLTGESDMVPGTIATNYMTIRQQALEIANRAITASGAEYTAVGAALGWIDPGNVRIATVGGVALNVNHAQFQFDNLTTDGTGNYYLLTTAPTLAGGASCVLPDFAPLGPAQAGTPTSADYNTLTGQFLRAPLNSVRNVKCGDALREWLRWIGGMGGPQCWTDYSTNPPTLKVTTRDQLPSISLPVPASGGASAARPSNTPSSLKIKRRDDLSLPCLHLKYNVSGSLDGQPYDQLNEDVAAYLTIGGIPTLVEGCGIAGNLKWIGDMTTTVDAHYGAGTKAALFAASLRPYAVQLSQDYVGSSIAQERGVIQTLALPSTAAGWVPFFPHLSGASALALLSGTGMGITVTPEGGSTVSLATYLAAFPAPQCNILDPAGGPVLPWMVDSSGNRAFSQKVRLSVPVSYLDAAPAPTGATVINTAGVASQPNFFDCTLTNLTGGTYYSAPQFTAGEPVPFGLAGYVLAIQNVTQFEGTITFQETECTDLVPMGNNLCLTGGLAEWAAMNAQVQQIEMDLIAGSTSVTIGPAKHLGARDISDLLRANRGPSTYRLFGSNLLNQ